MPSQEPTHNRGRRTVIDFDSPTVMRILDAAMTLFAENSFSGTRMDDIAVKAKVNKATVYYHIGGKERIYEVVLHEHIKTFADTLEKRLEGIDNPVEGLLELVRHHAEASMTDDRGPRTVAHELAGGARRMTPAIVTQYARVYAATIRVMQAGVSAGHLKNLNPAFAHLLLAAPLFMSAINRPFRPLLFNHELIRDQPPLPQDELVALLERVVIEFLSNTK